MRRAIYRAFMKEAWDTHNLKIGQQGATMRHQESDYTLPPEYQSMLYLHLHLGDVETVVCVCNIWNKLHQGDTLRLLRVEEMEGFIIITGKCVDTPAALDICRYLTTWGVAVKHEKTIRTETWEV